jgi:predicted RNase H-related nuclease YkuK (DUF458 family)
MEIINGFFYNPTKGKLSFDEVISEIEKYIIQEPEKEYELIVGCDSSSGQEPFFPLCIVLLRKGEGGRFFLKRIQYPQKKFYSFKERVLQEVFLSCELALDLREVLERKFGQKSYKFSFKYIHADVGENGATKEMVKEVINLIKSNGFEPKIKPEAFAASVVADKYS